MFFFQAEDGIRDLTVTGVQTCALPISARCTARRPLFRWRKCCALPCAERLVRAPDHGARTACLAPRDRPQSRSEEHTSELQSQSNLVCRLLLEKKKTEPNPLMPLPRRITSAHCPQPVTQIVLRCRS